MAEEGGGPRHIQSILIGVRLLRQIEEAGAPVSLKDLSARAGMASGQTHLYLVSLRMAGLIVQDPATSRYSLGPYALQLGLAALRQTELVESAREVMGRIRDDTGETIYLAVWANRGATIVSRFDSARQLPMIVKVGYALPLLTSAIGKVFLAHLPAVETRDRLEEERLALRAQGLSAARVSALEASVPEVRALGFALTENLSDFTGFAGMATPVFDHEGGIVASLAVVGPKDAIDVAPGAIVHTSLVAGAAALSGRLGYRAPGGGSEASS